MTDMRRYIMCTRSLTYVRRYSMCAKPDNLDIIFSLICASVDSSSPYSIIYGAYYCNKGPHLMLVIIAVALQLS